MKRLLKAANQTNSNEWIRENSWTGQDSFGLEEKTFEDDEIEERGGGSEDGKKKEGGIEEGSWKKEEDGKRKEEGGRREDLRKREDEGRIEIRKTCLSDRQNGDILIGKM